MQLKANWDAVMDLAGDTVGALCGGTAEVWLGECPPRRG